MTNPRYRYSDEGLHTPADDDEDEYEPHPADLARDEWEREQEDSNNDLD